MWEVEVLGEKFSERELTIGQYIKLEDELGVTWRMIHPVQSAKAARAVIGLLYAERKNLSVDHARSIIESQVAWDFVDSIEKNLAAALRKLAASRDVDDEEDEEKADPPKAA